MAELDRLKGELKAVQSDLDTLKQATSAEEREKAEIIAAEKKSRNQVSFSPFPVCDFNYRGISLLYGSAGRGVEETL